MYDSLSENYDRFVNWAARLEHEIPFIESQITGNQGNQQPIRILDAACGTGMHAVALAMRGFEVAGADLSPEMIDRAVVNTRQAGVQVEFQTAGFGELRQHFTGFDALLCLGNSLPHILSPEGLKAALEDFADCLRPGGLLIIQNRNFEAVIAEGARWMNPEGHQEGGREWLFIRFYDFDPDQLITFHVLTLEKTLDSTWKQQIASTRLRPLFEAEMVSALKIAGFVEITCFGGLNPEPFDAPKSANLVIQALKSR